MHTTLSKQFLQITIAFLICTGVAWATDTTRFGNYTAQDDFYGFNTGSQFVGTAASNCYTAVAGDTLISIGTYALATCTDNMWVALSLYVMDRTATSKPTDLVAVDTAINVRNTVADSYFVSMRVGLTPGTEYAVTGGNAHACGNTLRIYYNTVSDTTRWGSIEADPWNITFTSTGYGTPMIWGSVEHNAEAPPAATIPFAPSKLATVKVAP